MLGLFDFVVASSDLVLESEEHIGHAQDQGLDRRVRLEHEGQQAVFHYEQAVVDIVIVLSLFGVSSAKAYPVVVNKLLSVSYRERAPECVYKCFHEQSQRRFTWIGAAQPGTVESPEVGGQFVYHALLVSSNQCGQPIIRAPWAA